MRQMPPSPRERATFPQAGEETAFDLTTGQMKSRFWSETDPLPKDNPKEQNLIETDNIFCTDTLKQVYSQECCGQTRSSSTLCPKYISARCSSLYKFQSTHSICASYNESHHRTATSIRLSSFRMYRRLDCDTSSNTILYAGPENTLRPALSD